MVRPTLAAVAILLSLAVFGERVEIRTSCAQCVIDTIGARVVSYKTQSHGEILWNDNPIQVEDAEWAHGGIPVCWPYYGLDRHGRFHGFAWKRPFRLVEKKESPARSEAVFRLETDRATLDCHLRLSDETLKLTLVTRNVSTCDFTFSEAFHPYFRVGERDCATVSGVRAEPFSMRTVDEEMPAAKGSCKVYRLADPVLNRTLSLYVDNSDGVCVWNPGPEKNCPGTVPGEEWRRWVSVEPVAGGCGVSPVTLAPGQSHAMAFEIRPRRGSAVTGFAGRDSRYPDAAEKNFRLPFRALFIGAHPDDAEYDFGAAAAKLVAAGAKVTFVSVSNGDRGHQTMKPEALAARRFRETQASAKVYGIERYIVMGEHDCLIEPTVELRQRVTRLIREFEPNMVVTHRTCDYHADHRATGQVVQDSMYLVGVPLFAPETPVPELLPFAMYAEDQFTVPRPLRADYIVDGEDVKETIVRALCCHESQLFEWLPPEYGVDPKSIPADDASRRSFVRSHAMLDLRRKGERHQALCARLFGWTEPHCVNVFELCEYSRLPTPAERSFLAKLPGSKWVDTKDSTEKFTAMCDSTGNTTKTKEKK